MKVLKTIIGVIGVIGFFMLLGAEGREWQPNTVKEVLYCGVTGLALMVGAIWLNCEVLK